MSTTPTKTDIAASAPFSGASVPAWPRGENPASSSSNNHPEPDTPEKPSHRDALQALIAFSALHEQVRRRKSLAAQLSGFDAGAPVAEFEERELFVLDEVLQLVAERAVAITGADGLAIALAENNEIVLRASAGNVKPDVGARIDRNSAFSGACFAKAEIVMCDDTETDPRVNLQACRRLGARSMIAVPLCGRRRVIGLIEAFSSWPFGFNDSDVRNLSLLAELVLGALKPEDEDRFAQSAQVAATKLQPAPRATQAAVTPAVPVAPVQASAARVETAAPQATLKPVAAAPVPAVEPPKLPKTEIVSAPVVAPPAIPAKPAAAILDKPTAPAEKFPELEPLAAAAPEPELTFGQAETAEPKRRPIMLIALVCLVVAAAFAAGVLWKLKMAQMGSAMVQTEKPVLKPTTTASPSEPTTTEATADANVPDVMQEPTQDTTSPASPQDMAKFPRVTGVRHWSAADSTSVVLDLEDQVQYEAHRLNSPDRIYFDLHDTQLAPELTGKSIDVGDPLLNRIRVAQPVAGMTRIVLDTKANTNFSVSLEPNPYRLVVEVRKIGVNPKGMVNLFPNSEAEKNRLAIVVPPPTKEDLALRARIPKMRIVVDAGHGGWDLGTVGRRGLLEKDVVLEIAERLGKLLQSRLGMDVIYTRQDDNYVALDERASIANESQADLFVSVHANYSDLPSARGVETYYTNVFSAPGSKEAGSKEAGAKEASLKEPKDPDPRISGIKPAITPVLSATDLHDRIEQSKRLAASVQRSLYGALVVQNPGLRDRGIKEAGFVVLTESAMPGILAEVSFVSSPTDEQKLRSDGYREQIAEALYKGIARYAVASKSVKVASAKK